MAPDALEPLPPTLASMWRLCKLGFRYERGLMALSLAMSQLASLPSALTALWLALLGAGVVQHEAPLALGAAAGMAVSAAANWFLMTVSTRVQRRFRDKVTIALEAHVARLQASIVSVAHQERPEYLDRLSMLRNQVFVLDHMYMSLFTTLAWIMRLAFTLALLAWVNPALLVLGLFAAPSAVAAFWRPDVENRAYERGAQEQRLSLHLFDLATTAAPGKEVRVLGIGERLARDRRAAWEAWYRPMARARWGTAMWNALAWAVFGGAYVGAVAFVVWGMQATTAQVLLVLAAGASLAGYIRAAVAEIGFLRGFWADGSRRLAWLEDYAAKEAAPGEHAAPAVLREGIRFDNVSFAYPGATRLALDKVSFTLPARAVVAIVGENGAGKTTLVKLLAKMYEPASGAILIDGAPLSRIRAADWRGRITGALQDFFRFEFRARQTIGLGDVGRMEEERAVAAAAARAGADDVVAGLPAGLDTQLGRTWPGGAEPSFGQWQKLSLARGFMREAPLVQVLDEPTAALDAETEHALFERYAAAARAGGDDCGRITILVSHRFSTVRMADLIIVLDGARLAESGSHDELMARRGPYSELYDIQAAAYRANPAARSPAQA
ncbi:MAG TPA: ABC transporter ATP-binding protein [Caulobacteraceae bacterium]|nr:ABC transporter ATP-binding protein [Caulobacteraceae bacterium]